MLTRNLTTSGFPKSAHVTCRPEVMLTAYNGGEINQHGAISLMCRYKQSEWHNINFYIAESEGPVILGLAHCKLMNILAVLCDYIGIDVSAVNRSNVPVSAMSEIHNIEDLKSAFPQSFDTLGNFREEYQLTDSCTSCAPMPQVRYTGSLSNTRRTKQDGGDQSDSEGDRAHRLGVKSDLHRDGPQRLCLDPKDINQALKMPYHKTPTLEKITHHFSGATFFSKLNAKNG